MDKAIHSAIAPARSSVPTVDTPCTHDPRLREAARINRLKMKLDVAHDWGSHLTIHPAQAADHLMPGGPESYCEPDCLGRLTQWMVEDLE